MTTYFTTHMHEIAKDIEDDKDIYPYCDNLFIVTEQTSRGPRYTYKIMKGRADHSGAAQLAEAKGCDEAALEKLLESRILTNSLPVTNSLSARETNDTTSKDHEDA
jgi:DNA mismatch repair ATPase MutS